MIQGYHHFWLSEYKKCLYYCPGITTKPIFYSKKIYFVFLQRTVWHLKRWFMRGFPLDQIVWLKSHRKYLTYATLMCKNKYFLTKHFHVTYHNERVYLWCWNQIGKTYLLSTFFKWYRIVTHNKNSYLKHSFIQCMKN